MMHFGRQVVSAIRNVIIALLLWRVVSSHEILGKDHVLVRIS